MKKAKFTKGPWVEYLGASNIVEVHNSDGLEVVNRQGFDGNGNFSNQTVEANAYLIASAPEMYEMLNKLRLALENQVELNLLVSKNYENETAKLASDAYELLAKARGEA